jgi:hypothetical protein
MLSSSKRYNIALITTDYSSNYSRLGIRDITR